MPAKGAGTQIEPTLESEPAGSRVPPPYTGPPVAAAISAFGSEYAATSEQPIIVSRSGGLAPLVFENKLGNWLTAGASVSEYYDSNVFLRSTKVDDFVTSIAPSLAFRYGGKFLDWSLGTSLNYQYYARGTRTENLSYSLNTGGVLKLYRDYAFINISDIFTQTSQTTGVDYSSLSSTINVTNLNTLTVNPRLVLPLTGRLSMNPQYSYINYWYPSQSQQNRQSNSVSADFSYELTPRLTPALGYRFVKMDGRLLQYSQHYPYIKVTWQNERLTFSGAVGYDRVDQDLGATSSGMIWDASLDWQFSTMTLKFTTASDINQSNYQNSTSQDQTRKAPQTITSYTLSLTKYLRIATFAISSYYRENTDTATSEFLSRNIGTSGSLAHEISQRLSGNFTYRVEWQKPQVNMQAFLYQFGYSLVYPFGNNWSVTGLYQYINSNSASQITTNSTYNYIDNKISFGVSKSFL